MFSKKEISSAARTCGTVCRKIASRIYAQALKLFRKLNCQLREFINEHPHLLKFLRNRLPHIRSLRFRVASAYAILSGISFCILLTSGFLIFKNRMLRNVDRELIFAAQRLELIYCGADKAVNGEGILSSSELPEEVKDRISSLFPGLYIAACRQESPAPHGCYKITGALGISPVELQIKTDGSLFTVRKSTSSTGRRRMQAFFDIAPGDLAFQAIFNSKNQLHNASAGADGLPPTDALLANNSELKLDNGTPVKLFKTPFLGTSHTLVLGKKTDELQQTLYGFVTTFAGIFIPIFILTCGAGWWIVQHSLEGIALVTKSATSFGAGHLHTRVPSRDTCTEVGVLASAFNTMADQIQRLLMQQKHLTENIAHDLRTPITRMRLGIESAMASESGEELLQAGEKTLENCTILINMIDTMLEITRADSGTIKLETNPVDLYQLTEKALEIFRFTTDSKDQKLIFSGASPCFVNGDVSRLQRVIANLIDNARKYTGKGGRISVSVKTHDQNAVLTVKDNGPGIPKKELKNVFQRFYRCDHSRTTPGNGLGLALVKALIELHGGSIHLQNLNPGLRVQVKIPKITEG